MMYPGQCKQSHIRIQARPTQVNSTQVERRGESMVVQEPTMTCAGGLMLFCPTDGTKANLVMTRHP